MIILRNKKFSDDDNEYEYDIEEVDRSNDNEPEVYDIETNDDFTRLSFLKARNPKAYENMYTRDVRSSDEEEELDPVFHCPMSPSAIIK